MKKTLKVQKTFDLGPTEVALVWDETGAVVAYVSDAELAQAPPPHALQAFALMLSLDDPEIMGRMWEKIEKKMDAELSGEPPTG